MPFYFSRPANPESPNFRNALYIVYDEFHGRDLAARRWSCNGAALFDRAGRSLHIKNVNDATALLLCGEPIDKPFVGQGPFVMNTAQEIRYAMTDYQSGKMGRLS